MNEIILPHKPGMNETMLPFKPGKARLKESVALCSCIPIYVNFFHFKITY